MTKMSDPSIEEMLAFAVSRLVSGESHQHHSACVHNLSREEQLDLRRRNHNNDSEFTDEEMAILGLDRNIVVIKPDDWEIEAPWEPSGR